MGEVVVAHAQAIARLAGIHGVSAIGKGIAHIFQGAGGAKQFDLRVLGMLKLINAVVQRSDILAVF